MSALADVAERDLVASVVISTYNRPDSVVRLLEQLGNQTFPPGAFEVIVVDDGSSIPVSARLADLRLPYRLRSICQQNAGPAAARHAGILQAQGQLIVILDDDMCIGPEFLSHHVAAHAADAHRVVLGRLRADPGRPLRLFDRMTLRLLDKLAERTAAGVPPCGTDVYTGNVSFPRADYFEVSGFDLSFRLSEDAEFGLRLQQAGASFALSNEAEAVHASDQASVGAWMRRAIAYGVADARVAAKHPTEVTANPWRFLFRVNWVSRPLLLLSAFAPTVMRPLAWTAMGVALFFDRLGAERPALAVTTLVYGLQYYAGVRCAAGTRRRALGGLRRYLNAVPSREIGWIGRCAKCLADIRADQEAMQGADEKYRQATRRRWLLTDAISRIGFQMMIAYRGMRLARDLHLGFVARVASRMMRHLYGAEIHWHAELAPGVIVVHGNGLVISHAARVGAGCVLFQHVTLGESIHPDTRVVGAPALEPQVHVGAGAVLLGPIMIGQGTKIMANAVVIRSVPPQSLVETPAASYRPRGTIAGDVETPLRSRPSRARVEPTERTPTMR